MRAASSELWRRVWEAVGPVDVHERLTWLAPAVQGERHEPEGPPAPERHDPSGRFAPWELQERARDTEGDERVRWLNRCIVAFDAIATQPVDPGNDEGPFHAVARWMDRDQVDRALAVVERMAPFPWIYRMGGSRAALTGRLAALGDLDAAWEQLARFDQTDAFAGHWLAVAKGSWAGCAVHLSVDERLRRVRLDALPDAQRWQVLTCAGRAGPVADQTGAWLEATARVRDPRLRSLAVRHLAAARWDALPPAAWIDAVRAEQGAAMALLELVDVGGVEVLRVAESELRRAPVAEAFGELLRHPMADPWVVEACAEAWLEGEQPNRFDLEPDALRHWLQRRIGASPSAW